MILLTSLALAEEVIAGDERIDADEVELEEECLKVLALYQPVAVDLRYIVAVLKINNDLERIGDIAVSIAKRGKSLSMSEVVNVPFDITDMAEKVGCMLAKSLDALVRLDTDLAQAVLDADDEVDLINTETHDEASSIMLTLLRRLMKILSFYLTMIFTIRPI